MFTRVQFQLLTPTEENLGKDWISHWRLTQIVWKWSQFTVTIALTKARNNKRTQTVHYWKTTTWKERVFSRYLTGGICAVCFEYIGMCLSHRRNTKELVPIVYVMKVVWPLALANSFQMLVSTTVAISYGGCSLSNVIIQSKIKSALPLSEKLCSPRLASGTNIIGILINLKIDLRVE